jgi:hypothetical protein
MDISNLLSMNLPQMPDLDALANTAEPYTSKGICFPIALGTGVSFCITPFLSPILILCFPHKRMKVGASIGIGIAYLLIGAGVLLSGILLWDQACAKYQDAVNLVGEKAGEKVETLQKLIHYGKL